MSTRLVWEFRFKIGDIVTLKGMHAMSPAKCAAFVIRSRLLLDCGMSVMTSYGVRAICAPTTWTSEYPTLATHMPQSILGERFLDEFELMPFPDESRAIYSAEVTTRR